MSDDSYPGTASHAAGGSDWGQMEFAIRSIVNGLATATLVQVKAVGAGTVDVQPMVHQLDAAKNAVPHGTIHALPIWRLQGGGNAVIVEPASGDIGLAIFASSDTSAVQANKSPSPPGSSRRFDWADGVYLGGVLNTTPTQSIRFLPMGGIEITATANVTVQTSGNVRLNAGLVSTSGTLATDTGATGSFTTQDGKTVTVTSGIVTKIV